MWYSSLLFHRLASFEYSQHVHESTRKKGRGIEKNICSSKNPLFDEGKELLVTFPLFHYLDHINGLKTAIHLVPQLWKCSLLPGCFFSVQNFAEVCAHIPLVNNNGSNSNLIFVHYYIFEWGVCSYDIHLINIKSYSGKFGDFSNLWTDKKKFPKNPLFKNIWLWNKNKYFEPGFIQWNCMQMCAFLIRECLVWG